MRIIIDNADQNDFNELAKLARAGKINTFRMTDDERPQDECVDISKLRLMTVEECAGHTIDYALGWKACIEWIKRGCAE